jgi:hypothetical protein
VELLVVVLVAEEAEAVIMVVEEVEVLVEAEIILELLDLVILLQK